MARSLAAGHRAAETMCAKTRPPHSATPTESFPIANGRILALVLGAQLATDRLMGLGSFFAPRKESPNLVQGTRLRILVDGDVAECLDGDETRIVSRGYLPGTGQVRVVWRQCGLEVEDIYFIPPSLDIVVQSTRIVNLTGAARRLSVAAILYPQLGSEVHHKKGVCRAARFDEASGAALVEDLAGNVLVYGFDRFPSGFQVGEVCGRTDVYYDLEDGRLGGNRSVEGVVPNAALGLDAELPAGGEWIFETCLGRADDESAAIALLTAYRERRETLAAESARHSAAILDRSPVPDPDGEFGPRLAAIERRGRLVLNACLLPAGPPLGGFTCYHNVGQTRNSCYILLALDLMGYHEEARRGYGYYADFKVGDQRFASADENDQLGTILHVFRRHTQLVGEASLWLSHRAALDRFADRLVTLADPANGLVYSERSIHEYVAISRGYETYVNVMAWRGLADAAAMARDLGEPDREARYRAASEALRSAILSGLVDPELGIFVKRVHMGRRVPLPAISMLAPALFGLVDPRDETVTRSIAYLLEHLWDPSIGGLYRYPLGLQPWAEHPYGGPWVTYTSWLGRVYLLRGEKEKAAELIRWALDLIPEDSGLIPEHFSVAHAGERGFHRVYLDPSTPELWATAEFLRFVLAYREATSAGSADQRSSAPRSS
jgi:hypothetical protein